jgi:hypothetical protein
MAVRALLAALVATAAAGCGSDSEPTAEVVVADATLGGAQLRVLGATSTTLFWASSQGSTTLVGSASLSTLPAQGVQIATSTGPVAQAGGHVVVVADGLITRVDPDGTARRIVTGMPGAVAGNAAEPPTLAWAMGADLSWGVDDAQQTVALTKVDACNHLRVTSRRILVAADSATGRRVLSVDQRTGTATAITSSEPWAPMFPGGAQPGSTYVGRIVDGDDDSVLWLVEEMPSRRGIVISLATDGEPAVLLPYLSGASGFFATTDALYWQEDDALLMAARTGGAASIVATVPGAAGAVVDGYVYFANGAAIERQRIE